MPSKLYVDVDMKTSSSDSRSRDHIPELDGVRGIAVLMVLLVHLKSPVIPGIPMGPGMHGVDLFFYLSGFLITRIRMYEQEQGISLLPFWIRRGCRIFPAAYLCLLLIWMTFGGTYHLLMAATYTSTFDLGLFDDDNRMASHFWTLSVEEQFYLLWPFFLYLPMRFLKFISLFSCIGFAALFVIHGALGRLWGEGEDIYHLLNYQVFTRGWPLMAGSFIAIVEPSLKVSPEKLFRYALATLAAGISIKIVAFRGKHLPIDLTTFGWFGMQIAMLGIFLWALWLSYTRRKSFLTNSVLVWVGQISYGLYLYHLPVYYLTGARGGNGHPLVGLAGTFILASLSFYAYERPIINLGRRWSRLVATTNKPVGLNHSG